MSTPGSDHALPLPRADAYRHLAAVRRTGARPRTRRAGPQNAAATRRAPALRPAGVAPALGNLFRIGRWQALAIVLAVSAAVHAPALDTWFAQDDVTFLARARGLEPVPWSVARPLYEGVTFRVLHALFGLEPFPYHVVNLLLHLANTTFVFLIGERLLGGRGAAAAAAILFGASSIAFTPLHWTAGILELQVTALALGAFLLFLAGGRRGSPALLWLGALAGLAAALTKENAALLPLVLLAATWRLGDGSSAGRWRDALPQTVLSTAFIAAYLVTLRAVHFAGSEAYERDLSPRFLAENLATYLRWCVALQVPVRDALAAADPRAWRMAAPVLALVAWALWAQRRAAGHPVEVGLVWFLAMLLPVLPLAHRSYLYYLYLPWAGACWMLAACAARLAARRASVAWTMGGALAAFVAIEAWSVRARERAVIGTQPLDKVMRESGLLHNAITGLRAAGLPAGSRVAFVNPGPRRHFNVAAPDQGYTWHATGRLSYVPLEGALRGGEALRVFMPELEYLGLGGIPPPAWDEAQLFLFRNDGRLEHLGSGARALTELGTIALDAREVPAAESLFARALARGDTLADAVYGLAVTSDLAGRSEESKRWARTFLERWPAERRAPALREALERSSR
jgi:hypothetical protein